jgi:signal transduction histidine kinase/CheY-like chemotaxis protein
MMKSVTVLTGTIARLLNNLFTLPRSTSRNNYLQLLFVFAAFALMAVTSYLFIGRILQSRLLSGANELLFSAEANVRAGLSEAETTLLNSYHIVQGMIERNAGREEIFDYLTLTTEWMRMRDQGLMGYRGIYGYINGEFYDTIGINPGPDYIPQTRPWYQTGIRSGNSVAYTPPYRTSNSENTIVSAVRNIDLKNGDMAGILVVDIDIDWLVEYAGSLALTSGGYGMLLSQNMTFMAYPDNAFIGRQLQDLGGAYSEIARTLRSGGEISAEKINNSDGRPVIVFFKHIFNNWYVGLVTPYSQFYSDLHTSARILAALGFVLALSLCFILLRLSAAKMRASEESKSKSSFLASMSHEIRTPMNAIVGMAELLLRGELSDEARSRAQDIKQAGNNLVSIINDILDFSKIEAGKMEIVPVKYMLSSLINDSVNIIRMRIGEKPLRFFTNIDGTIPNNLIGDEVRLRQILLNLLSNAVKYSERGHIGLTITIQKRDQQKVWLKIAVSDTGKGIKQKDQAKLFDEFVQVDVKKNRSIEGTGLGLAITKRLCIAMDGNIPVESEYGKGSTFTATISQNIESETPIAAVEEPEKKNVLVYEGRAIYAQAVSWSLNNMKVPYTMVTNFDDFKEALYRAEWFYVFSGYGLYDKIKPLLEQADTAFCGGKKPPLALMVEWGTEAYMHDVRFVSIPVQSLSSANILNGKTDSKGYNESSGIIRYTFPAARLLVVDDIATNLKVAEGLLAPYRTTVDTCLSGLLAIDKVQQAASEKRDYDIIFMDHMMPEMDGIEAMEAIRELEMRNEELGIKRKQIPIIALTANAVVGMREMFIEKGFNDFLSKPIDVSKLDDMLNHWIAREKRVQSPDNDNIPNSDTLNPDPRTPNPIIPNVDVQKGIAMTGGTLAAYKQVLSMFCKDAKDRLPLLQNTPEIAAMSVFITHVHALKSASASLGAEKISVKAAELETAGRTGDTAFIREHLPAFTRQLTELVRNIEIALETKKPEDLKPVDPSVLISHSSLFQELAEALKSQNAAKIAHILYELNQKPLDSKIRETVEKISDDVLITEFDNALKTIEELLDLR